MDLRDIGINKISDDAPSGHDATYEETYELLSEEIKKQASPTADAVTDWKKVKELSVKILSSESKNLQVACYLSIALFLEGSLKDGAEGIHILRDLIEHYWEQLFPPLKRKKGRINALEWWDDKLKELLRASTEEEWPTDERQAVLDDINAMDDFLSEHLPDAPMLRPLADVFSRLLLEKTAPPPESKEERTENREETSPPAPTEEALKKTEETVAQPAQPKDKETSPSAPEPVAETAPSPSTHASDSTTENAGALEGVDDAKTLLKDAATGLSSTASALRKADPGNPASYQLLRVAAWSSIEKLPPAHEAKTMLPPPDQQLIQMLGSHKDGSNWPALIETAEANIRRYLFWLDLSYYTAFALENQGISNSARVVADATRQYCDRLPGLEELSFSDGTPFAGGPAKAWLSEINGSGQATSSAPGKEAEEVLEIENQAMQLLKKKNIAAAISLLKEKARTAPDNRSRFLFEISLCRLFQKANKPDFARPYAHHFLEQIERCHLDKWEPELATQALLSGLRCLQQINSNEDQEILKKLKDTIILLSPELIA